MWSWIFFYLSVLWNCYAYTYSFFDNISHTFCGKTAIHYLVCLLRFSLLTTCSVIVHTSSTFWHLFLFLTEWPENNLNRCLRSSTNSVGLHFHEGVEKIKENDKNTKIENLLNIVLENSLPKGLSWWNKKNWFFFYLSSDSRYLQTTALKGFGSSLLLKLIIITTIKT